MNTAERRWVITVPIQTPDEWDQVLFRVADFALEAIVENDGSADIYFVEAGEAKACADALGVSGPTLSGAGTGEVFGQQSHATTELCLELLPSLTVGRSADIGSGTGKLAAESARRGASLVIAVDLDWPAAQSTHNLLSTRPHAYAVQASADALATGAFDLVLANLHLSLWRELANDIARISAPDGTLVASGFLDSQAAEVESMLATYGWRIVEQKFREGWFAVRAARSV